MLRANYTWRAILTILQMSCSAAWSPAADPEWSNLGQDRGRSVLDITHKVALSWVYELPQAQHGQGFIRTLANGWQWSVPMAQSGQPVSILSGVDST